MPYFEKSPKSSGKKQKSIEKGSISSKKWLTIYLNRAPQEINYQTLHKGGGVLIKIVKQRGAYNSLKLISHWKEGGK